jgi:hypothetical protein
MDRSGRLEVTGAGFSEEESPCRDATAGRLRRAELGRQVVAGYHAGETLHALSRRHDPSRSLVRIRVETSEAGARDRDGAAAGLPTDDAARIAAPERLGGRPTLEIAVRKGACAPDPRAEAQRHP